MWLVRLAIAVVVVAALAIAIQRSIQHWNSQPPASRLRVADLDFRWLLLSAGLYAAGLLPAIMVLSRALVAVGATASLRSVASAQLVGHLGKYVPGKAMVIVIRAAILNRGGASISIRAATIAITIETLTVISTGAMIALLVLQTWDTPTWMKQASALMAVGAGVAASPPMLRFLMARRLVGGNLPFKWTARDMVVAWFWNSLGWLLLGGSMTAVVLAMPEHVRPGTPSSIVDLYLICLAAISLAFAVGFATFLPGGAGVRELVLTVLLTSVTGPSGALLAAIMMRMIHLAVEIALAGIAWGLSPKTGLSTTDVDERLFVS
jgi:glycosyltransferase 2 family protein